MKIVKNAVASVVLICLLLVLLSRDAHAYIDPGTGSFIFQLIIGGLIGSAFAIKLFWRNIKGFFHNLFSKSQEEKDDEE
jgi:hypothetical protein